MWEGRGVEGERDENLLETHSTRALLVCLFPVVSPGSRTMLVHSGSLVNIC